MKPYLPLSWGLGYTLSLALLFLFVCLLALLLSSLVYQWFWHLTPNISLSPCPCHDPGWFVSKWISHTMISHYFDLFSIQVLSSTPYHILAQSSCELWFSDAHYLPQTSSGWVSCSTSKNGYSHSPDTSGLPALVYLYLVLIIDPAHSLFIPNTTYIDFFSSFHIKPLINISLALKERPPGLLFCQ